jgi:hypothetical protein
MFVPVYQNTYNTTSTNDRSKATRVLLDPRCLLLYNQLEETGKMPKNLLPVKVAAVRGYMSPLKSRFTTVFVLYDTSLYSFYPPKSTHPHFSLFGPFSAAYTLFNIEGSGRKSENPQDPKKHFHI